MIYGSMLMGYLWNDNNILGQQSATLIKNAVKNRDNIFYFYGIFRVLFFRQNKQSSLDF